MIIGIIGENCTGKSTLAEALKQAFGAEIYSGKDYLRLAKSEGEAAALFKEKLRQAAAAGETIVYVISEPAQTALLPAGAVKILCTADLETIKERFKARMHGVLPPPVAQMLERKHGLFDSGDYFLRYDGAHGDPAQVVAALQARG